MYCSQPCCLRSAFDFKVGEVYPYCEETGKPLPPLCLQPGCTGYRLEESGHYHHFCGNRCDLKRKICGSDRPCVLFSALVCLCARDVAVVTVHYSGQLGHASLRRAGPSPSVKELSCADRAAVRQLPAAPPSATSSSRQTGRMAPPCTARTCTILARRTRTLSYKCSWRWSLKYQSSSSVTFRARPTSAIGDTSAIHSTRSRRH